MTFFSKGGQGLQDEGRFPDPGVTADQDKGAGDNPSSQDSIQFPDGCRNTLFFTIRRQMQRNRA